MLQINSYLTFNGNCREAMTFYKECLGGELIFQTLGESALSNKMPKKMKDAILQATLTTRHFILMASDMVPENGLIKGNSVSLSLNCGSEEEIKKCYTKLSENGIVKQPLEENFWGALFGDLTDKYGNNWILNCNTHKIEKQIK
ncbi:VOC family protein [Flavobacterium jejuense]|uniref:VOC family protein n=1 Tax=Flavobacterium jejuense TaxID=1544455 RepID=A0ABX0IRV9_9FLAO|nr:VOC family protein [Flavobacterium jejuense]NHN25951.1 VOC family protein [Flavobacterium jejuense]